MKLSIIIVNYNTFKVTCNCLDSIFKSLMDFDFEIILVDNASKKCDADEFLKKFPTIKLIKNKTNEGFGRANNIGIKKAKGEYILLLNSDIVLNSNTIKESISKIHLNSNIGALGCKLINMDGSVQKSTYTDIVSLKKYIYQNILAAKFLKRTHGDIEAIMGAFMLMPKRVLDKVGCFDPDFFMYSEELELCRRLKKARFEIIYYPNVYAHHVHGASSSGVKLTSLKQQYLSEALLVHKTRSTYIYIAYHVIMLVNSITNFTFMPFINKSYKKQYRENYYNTQRAYFSNFYGYFKILLNYSKTMGNGKNLLKRY